MISALLTVWSTQLLTDCVFHTKTLSCEGIGMFNIISVSI